MTSHDLIRWQSLLTMHCRHHKICTLALAVINFSCSDRDNSHPWINSFHMSRNFKGALQILLKEHTIMYHTQSVKAGEAIKVYPAVDNRLNSQYFINAGCKWWWWMVRFVCFIKKVRKVQFFHPACNLISYPQEGSACDFLLHWRKKKDFKTKHIQRKITT